MKVYCRDCKHANTLDGVAYDCLKILEMPRRNKYNDETSGPTEYCELSENANGTCKYYEPSAKKRFTDWIKGVFHG